MAYRKGERSQITFLPPCIEEYVAPEDPVRAYDAFVDALDLAELGIELNPYKVGNSEYDPKAMLKLLVYGYSYGIRSSRRLERATLHNLSFIWLLGGLKPDHKTISEFRRNHKKDLKKVLKQCVRMCIALSLIDGNILFADGSKFRANAARDKSYSKEHYEKHLAEIDAHVNKLLDECESIDDAENKHAFLVKMQNELKSSQTLRSRIKGILHEFEADKKINQTDPDCALMKGRQGSHTSYNAQLVVDDKHGLIVHADTVKDANDLHQFARQINQAEEITQKRCEVASADAGYAETGRLAKIDQRGTKVIVPSPRQASRKPKKPFDRSTFVYDKEQNCYYCPEGQKLVYRSKQNPNKLDYMIADDNICKQCKQYGICTKSKFGRKIVRSVLEETKEKFERQYEEETSQEIYTRRKSRVELPFGHIKHNLGMGNFLLRGEAGVRTEFSLAATCFNLVRMITIFGGASELIARIGGLQC